MLKTNLSTRPFYNERAVHWALAVAFAVIVALTVFNVTRVISLSARQGTLSAEVQREEARIQQLTAQAAKVRGSIDQKALERVIASAKEANAIIDQRTFSWTGLLAQLENTLPPDVRLTAISPRAELGVFRVSMAIVARDLENIDKFIDALTDTGRFYDVAPTEQRLADDGSYRAVIEASHLPATEIPAAGAPPAATGAAR